MPWHLSNEHPDCSGWAVVKDDTGDVVPGGCHPTEAEAQKHLAALNASEADSLHASASSSVMDTTTIYTPAPREDLIRMVPLLRAEASSDGNTMVGYAIRFNEFALIDSWEGRFRERVDPKATDKTLRERGDRVKVLFNHGFDPHIGDKPLGKPTVMEPRSAGLWTETPLDETSYNADLKASLRSGALDGMSFRFTVLGETWNNDTDDGIPERTITELKLFEFGPVTFPAYEATTAGVRNAGAYRAWRENFGAGFTSATDETQAAPLEGAGRGTDEAAAPELEGRGTSRADDEITTLARARIITLARELEHEKERIQWVRRQT